jgi:hypothetical protein
VRLDPSVRRWLLQRARPGLPPWRVEESDPSVRARVLAELLGRTADDAELVAARPPIYSMIFETPGTPSRWITTTALAVLQRAGR